MLTLCACSMLTPLPVLYLLYAVLCLLLYACCMLVTLCLPFASYMLYYVCCPMPAMCVRLQRSHALACAVGEYDKVAQGLFDNYLEVKFKDPRLHNVSRSLLPRLAAEACCRGLLPGPAAARACCCQGLLLPGPAAARACCCRGLLLPGLAARACLRGLLPGPAARACCRGVLLCVEAYSRQKVKSFLAKTVLF